jgi:hypothetical protein
MEQGTPPSGRENCVQPDQSVTTSEGVHATGGARDQVPDAALRDQAERPDHPATARRAQASCGATSAATRSRWSRSARSSTCR